MFSKVPILAWSLLALACFMVGAFLGEAQDQLDARSPLFPTIGVAVAVELNVEPPPTAPADPTPSPTPYRGPPSRN